MTVRAGSGADGLLDNRTSTGTVVVVEVLLIVVDGRPDPAPVVLGEVCSTAVLAGLLGVEWCRFDLVAAGCGYVAHLRGSREAVEVIAGSVPDGYLVSVLDRR